MELGFLSGCWRADARVEDINTGWPLRFTFCFTGRSGRGTLKVDETGSGKRARSACEAETASTLAGGRLEIRAGRARCPGSIRSYDPTTVVCLAVPGGAAAECSVRGADGAPIPARFTRLEDRG
ncbi:MAG: hypothetical protein LBT40_02095 [Deltaproteobacteria bacterium]|jgi:hypothetical protein|nr:hypothetical protein [Deltaproteobacteria bacterium]